MFDIVSRFRYTFAQIKGVVCNLAAFQVKAGALKPATLSRRLSRKRSRRGTCVNRGALEEGAIAHLRRPYNVCPAYAVVYVEEKTARINVFSSKLSHRCLPFGLRRCGMPYVLIIAVVFVLRQSSITSSAVATLRRLARQTLCWRRQSVRLRVSSALCVYSSACHLIRVSGFLRL